MRLRCTNLIKKYGLRTVVKNASFDVSQGEIVGLLGPNGAGKTTSFYMITGLVKPNGGKIFLDNEDITELPMYKRAQKGLGYLAQEASVFRKLTVEENISSVMELSKMSRDEQLERRDELIKEFSLEKVRKSFGIQLSGGERRRCEIARALAIDPKFILLDEPFAGVDPIAVEDIQHIISGLKTKNIGIIITDHNVYETLAITDRAYLLYEGSILYSGTPEELASNPDARRKYLGTNFDLRKAVLHDRKDSDGKPIAGTGNEGRYDAYLKGDVKEEMKSDVKSDVKSEMKKGMKKDVESEMKGEMKKGMKKDVESEMKGELKKGMKKDVESEMKSGPEDMNSRSAADRADKADRADELEKS